jgi:hypothetical protein
MKHCKIKETKMGNNFRKLMEEIIDESNHYGSEKEMSEAIVDVLDRSHRTLQQTFWRSIKDAMAKYGETEFFDLRNQASVEFCKAVTEEVSPEHPLPMI